MPRRCHIYLESEEKVQCREGRCKYMCCCMVTISYYLAWNRLYKFCTPRWQIMKRGWHNICYCACTKHRSGLFRGSCWLDRKWSRWCIGNGNTVGHCCVHGRGFQCWPCYKWYSGDVPLYCLLMRHSHQWFWQWPHGKNRVAWNLPIGQYHHLNK